MNMNDAARARFIIGPINATSAMLLRGFAKYRKSTITGFAHPKTGPFINIRKAGKMRKAGLGPKA